MAKGIYLKEEVGFKVKATDKKKATKKNTKKDKEDKK